MHINDITFPMLRNVLMCHRGNNNFLRVRKIFMKKCYFGVLQEMFCLLYFNKCLWFDKISGVGAIACWLTFIFSFELNKTLF